MIIVQTVAIVTHNSKDNCTYLLIFQELALVKYLGTWQSCENYFGQYFNLKKMKNLHKGFLKIIQFHIFDEKNKFLIKFCQKITLWSRHLYHEVYRLSQNFTEGNTRKVSACFLCFHACDIIKFRNNYVRMRINDPLMSLACLRGRRIVLISYVPS